MAEIVYLQTTNHQKLAEYERILGRHRIQVLQADTRKTVTELFEESKKGHKVIAVMHEKSNLYLSDCKGIDEPSCEAPLVIDNDTVLYELILNQLDGKVAAVELKNLLTAENRTALRVVTKNSQNEFVTKVYRSVIEGFILGGPDKEEDPSQDVFGWDDQFASTGTQMTYQKMRQRGIKLSGRDLVLAQFTRDHLHFSERRDMKANPQKPEKTVDFSRKMADFVKKDPYLNNPEIHLYGARNSWVNAINQGAYWQSAINRREGIYWNPGGNGGVPFTPKINKKTGEADHLHEIEFLNHDLGHRWMCPDLIFEGDVDPLSIRVQTTWRMMSEALTLVNGSMLFMDTLKKSGIEYDYEKRQIYPLFESLQGNFEHDPEALKQLFFANVRYALRNDDSVYKKMGADGQALQNYEEKYHAYFVEDYNWTEQNIKNMAEDKEKFKQWRKSIEPLAKMREYLKGVMTVSQCIEEMSKFSDLSREELKALSQDQLIELMFNYVYETNIKSILYGDPIEIDDELALKSGFLKYMTAQMYIFDVFDFVPESAAYRQRIISYLQLHMNSLTNEDIDVIRSHYNQYVDILFRRNVITQEDQSIYKEFFPQFPPHYIYYDRSAESYDPLDKVSERIWEAVK